MAEVRGRYVIEFKDIPAERHKVPELAVEERVGNFSEVELGFTQEMAVEEAKRCLSCRRCLGCALCLAECHAKAIDFEQKDEDIELEVDSIIIAPGAERFPSLIGEEYGYGKYLNVVTGLEFERILADKGPYCGLVVRPYDGEIPRKIAFIQCHEDGNSCTLRHTFKAIETAQKKVEGLESHLFVSDSKIEDSELEKFSGGASGVNIERARVQALKEIEETKNIVIEFADERGENQKEEFDMAVLSTVLDLPPEIEELNRKLGLETKSRRFWEIDDTAPVETSKTGVFFAGYDFID